MLVHTKVAAQLGIANGKSQRCLAGGFCTWRVQPDDGMEQNGKATGKGMQMGFKIAIDMPLEAANSQQRLCSNQNMS